MAHKAPQLSAKAEGPKSRFVFSHIFSTGRQTFYFAFFVLWVAIDVALLGLVSQQIHAHGRKETDWPTGKYQHAMGLLLCANIVSLLVGIFHGWLNIVMLMFFLFVCGVFFGTGAGIIEATPFGHGLQCSNPVSRFPIEWQSDVKWCSRVTAIGGLAWAMFALAVIGLFFAFSDKFSLSSKRSAIYDPELLHEKLEEPSSGHESE